MNAPSVRGPPRRRPSSRSRRRIRSRSSAAAFSVNVIVRIARDVDPVLEHRADEPLDEHRRLAAAGAGVEQQLAVAMLDRERAARRSSARSRLTSHSRALIGCGRSRDSRQPSGEHVCGHGVSSPERSRPASVDRARPRLLELARRAAPGRARRSRTAGRRPARRAGTCPRGRRSPPLSGWYRPATGSSPSSSRHRQHVQRHLELVARRSTGRPGTRGGCARSCSRVTIAAAAAARSTSTRSISPRSRTPSPSSSAGSESSSKPNRSSSPSGRQPLPAAASCAR